MNSPTPDQPLPPSEAGGIAKKRGKRLAELIKLRATLSTQLEKPESRGKPPSSHQAPTQNEPTLTEQTELLQQIDAEIAKEIRRTEAAETFNVHIGARQSNDREGHEDR